MSPKTLFIKISNAVWISEIHQQGPIIKPIEVNAKLVLSMVRKGYKVTAVDKATKKEVALTVLNATDPFKETAPAKKPEEKKVVSTEIGTPVVETPQVTVQADVVEATEDVTEEATTENANKKHKNRK